MNRKRAELLVERGRLLERVQRQRIELAGQLAPWVAAATTVTQWVEMLRLGVERVRNHPRSVMLAGALLALLGPRPVWRHARKGLLLWRTWRWVRTWLNPQQQRPSGATSSAQSPDGAQ